MKRRWTGYVLGWSLLLLPSRAWAATYYVATTGSDSVSCAQAQNPSTPRRTINQGIRCLASGETLIIQGGTYDEYIVDVVTPIPSGSGEDSRTTIEGAPGDTVILQPKVGYPGGGAIIDVSQSAYVTFEHLIVDGWNHQGVYTGISTGGQSEQIYAHHIRFKDLEIRFVRWSAIALFGFESTASEVYGGYHEVLQTSIHDSGIVQSLSGPNPEQPPGSHTFYITTGHNVIDHVVADGGNLTMFGIHIYDANYHRKVGNVIRNSLFRRYWGGAMIIVAADETVVENNLIYDNNCCSGMGIWVSFGTNNSQIRQNTFDNNPVGLYALDHGSGNVLANNIITNAQQGVVIDSAAPITLQQNLITQNPGGDYNHMGMTACPDTNICGSANPQFMSAGSADFHLQADSPAIDAGLTLSEVSTDFEGTPRPQGSGYDIGAYEYRATTLLPGDLDGNGQRDLADVRLLIYMLLGQQAKTPEADLTGDGAVTLADVQALIRLMVGLS